MRNLIESGIYTGKEKLAIDLFNKNQLESIDNMLAFGGDFMLIADPEFNHRQMNMIIGAAYDGINLSEWVTPNFDTAQMREVLSGLEADLNVAIYAKDEFDDDQMEEIRRAMVNGLPEEQVKIIANPNMDDDQMYFIRNNLENLLPEEPILNYEPARNLTLEEITYLVDGKYDEYQMKEIKSAMIKGLDYTLCSNPKIDSDRMELYFELIEEGYTEAAEIMLDLEFNDKQAKFIYTTAISLPSRVVNLNEYARPQYDIQKMKALSIAILHGIDTTDYRSGSMSGKDALEKVRLELRKMYTYIANPESKNEMIVAELNPSEQFGKLMLTAPIFDTMISAHSARKTIFGNTDRMLPSVKRMLFGASVLDSKIYKCMACPAKDSCPLRK